MGERRLIIMVSFHVCVLLQECVTLTTSVCGGVMVRITESMAAAGREERKRKNQEK